MAETISPVSPLIGIALTDIHRGAPSYLRNRTSDGPMGVPPLRRTRSTVLIPG